MSLPTSPIRPPHGIHIFGAAGTGTTTLAGMLAARLGRAHLDTDRFFWLPTDPPYQEARGIDDRLRLMREEMVEEKGWVLSGSLCGWGDPLIPFFDLAIFLRIPPDIRIERLRRREGERFGDALAPGGAMHQQHAEFIEWASSYDQGDRSVRSLLLHEEWIATLPCRLLRIEGDYSNEERMEIVMRELADTRSPSES